MRCLLLRDPLSSRLVWVSKKIQDERKKRLKGQLPNQRKLKIPRTTKENNFLHNKNNKRRKRNIKMVSNNNVESNIREPSRNKVEYNEEF